MKRIVIAALMVTLIPAWASGQERPKATKEGIQAREELLAACVGEVALLAGRRPVCVADLVLLANLSRKHATFVRADEGYVLEAHGACKVADRAV